MFLGKFSVQYACIRDFSQISLLLYPRYYIADSLLSVSVTPSVDVIAVSVQLAGTLVLDWSSILTMPAQVATGFSRYVQSMDTQGSVDITLSYRFVYGGPSYMVNIPGSCTIGGLYFDLKSNTLPYVKDC